MLKCIYITNKYLHTANMFLTFVAGSHGHFKDILHFAWEQGALIKRVSREEALTS